MYDLEFVLGRVPQHLSHQVALQLGQVAPRRRFARALAVIAGEVRHLAEEANVVRDGEPVRLRRHCVFLRQDRTSEARQPQAKYDVTHKVHDVVPDD